MRQRSGFIPLNQNLGGFQLRQDFPHCFQHNSTRPHNVHCTNSMTIWRSDAMKLTTWGFNHLRLTWQPSKAFLRQNGHQPVRRPDIVGLAGPLVTNDGHQHGNRGAGEHFCLGILLTLLLRAESSWRLLPKLVFSEYFTMAFRHSWVPDKPNKTTGPLAKRTRIAPPICATATLKRPPGRPPQTGRVADNRPGWSAKTSKQHLPWHLQFIDKS